MDGKTRSDPLPSLSTSPALGPAELRKVVSGGAVAASDAAEAIGLPEMAADFRQVWLTPLGSPPPCGHGLRPRFNREHDPNVAPGVHDWIMLGAIEEHLFFLFDLTIGIEPLGRPAAKGRRSGVKATTRVDSSPVKDACLWLCNLVLSSGTLDDLVANARGGPLPIIDVQGRMPAESPVDEAMRRAVAEVTGQPPLGEHAITDGERQVFELLREAVESESSRQGVHWRLVALQLERLLADIEKAGRRLRDEKPFSDDLVAEMGSYLQLGRLEARHDLAVGTDRKWLFDLRFIPEYQPRDTWTHQDHVARLLASAAAVELCLDLREFNGKCRDGRNRSYHRFSLIRRCRAPSCQQIFFFTGKKGQVVCSRKRKKGYGKSECRNEYDQLLRFLRKKHARHVQEGGTLSREEFVDKHFNDPTLLREFLS